MAWVMEVYVRASVSICRRHCPAVLRGQRKEENEGSVSTRRCWLQWILQ